MLIAQANIKMDRGVVFLASVPTNMRPSEVRLHLQQFGELFRHKFVPMAKKYVGAGSHRKLLPLQYRSAFVEFMNRDNAKLCAEQLNGSAVASKRRRKCFGQIWNVKYMGDGFTWGNVLEEREEQVRRHQQLEFSFRESERKANETFRKMVFRAQSAAEASKKRKPAPVAELPAEPQSTETPQVETPQRRKRQRTVADGEIDREKMRPETMHDADIPRRKLKRRTEGTTVQK